MNDTFEHTDPDGDSLELTKVSDGVIFRVGHPGESLGHFVSMTPDQFEDLIRWWYSEKSTD